MLALIKEKRELTKPIYKLVEDYSIHEKGMYTNYLSTVIMNSLMGYATKISKSVYIEIQGNAQLRNIEDVIAVSKVFRQGLQKAISLKESHSLYFKELLKDYDENGICLPRQKTYWHDEA